MIKNLTSHLGKAAYEMDKILCILVLLVSFSFTIWLALVVKQPVFTIGSLLTFIGCAAYFLLRKRLSQVDRPFIARVETSSRLYLALNIIFFVLLAYSILSFHLRPELYVRPLGYFISTALMATVMGIEVLFFPHAKSRTYFALFKIIVIALSLRWSPVLIFPNVVGVDPWAHQWFTTEILSNGYIPGGWAYSKLPLMHLLSGATSLITGLNYNVATMFSISSMQVICDALFAFLLARLIFAAKPHWRNRVGLLAALFIGVANHHIFMGYLGIPNTMGATFILPIIYFLFTARKCSLGNTVLALLLMLALILTHTVAAMCLIILLFVLWLGFHIYQRIRHQEITVPITFNIAVLFATGAVGWWAYMSGHLVALAQVIMAMFAVPMAVASPMFPGQAPLSESLFAYIGILLFFALSFMGLFYMMSKWEKEHSFAVATGGLVLLGIMFFAIIASRQIIPHRWIYFAQIMVAIPLGVAVVLIYETINRNLIRLVAPAALVLVLPFFLIISPQANADNPMLYPRSFVRAALTASELKGIDTILDIYHGTIGSDFGLKFPIKYSVKTHESEFVNMKKQFLEGDFRGFHNILVLIREEITKHAFPAFHDLPTRIDYDPRVVLAEQGFSLIYSNGSISAFVQ